MREQQRCWRALREAMREEGIEVLEPEALDRRRSAPGSPPMVRQGDLSRADPGGDRPGAPLPVHPQFRLLAGAVDEAEGGRGDPPPGWWRCPPRSTASSALDGRKSAFVALEQVVRVHLDLLFPGFDLRDVGVFRVLRDSDHGDRGGGGRPGARVGGAAAPAPPGLGDPAQDQRRRAGGAPRASWSTASASARRTCSTSTGCSASPRPRSLILRDRPGPGLRALFAALPRTHPRLRRRLLRRDPPEGHHRPPPL